MNASVRTLPAGDQLLTSARDLAMRQEAAGNHDTAATLRKLVDELAELREAAKGAIVIVTQATRDKTLAQLRATTLLAVAEKIAPVLDDEIEQRKFSGIGEYWIPLQKLSDELHASIGMARG